MKIRNRSVVIYIVISLISLGGRRANDLGIIKSEVSRERTNLVLIVGRGETTMREKVDPRRAQVAQVGEREGEKR